MLTAATSQAPASTHQRSPLSNRLLGLRSRSELGSRRSRRARPSLSEGRPGQAPSAQEQPAAEEELAGGRHRRDGGGGVVEDDRGDAVEAVPGPGHGDQRREPPRDEPGAVGEVADEEKVRAEKHETDEPHVVERLDVREDLPGRDRAATRVDRAQRTEQLCASDEEDGGE